MAIYPVTIITAASSVKEANERIKAYRQLFALDPKREVVTSVKGLFREVGGSSDLVFLERSFVSTEITSRSIKYYDNHCAEWVTIQPYANHDGSIEPFELMIYV